MSGEAYSNPQEHKLFRHPNSQNTSLSYRNKMNIQLAGIGIRQLMLVEKLVEKSEKLDHRANVLGRGFLTRTVSPIVEAPHTRQSDHFFHYNPDLGIFEAHYQSSATIVDILELNMLGRGTRNHLQDMNARESRKLAFIDTNGDFTDQATLIDLELCIIKNGTTTNKHTAFFEYEKDGALQTQPIPIDNIYCVSLAAPAQSSQKPA